jgi:hypothetical protein
MRKIGNIRSKHSVTLAFAISLGLGQLSAPISWAADCSKKTDAKSPACVSATAKPGVGGSMQTVQQGSAAAQKKESKANPETMTAGATQAKHERRDWAGQTAQVCKKGSLTLHLASGSSQCPSGFHKS